MKNMFTQYFLITGVKEQCVLSRCHGFHPVTNVGPDAFHDIPEGIAHPEISKAITSFFHTRKIQ